MDSLTVVNNTVALASLEGSLWAALGFISFLLAGTMMIYYTFRGH